MTTRISKIARLPHHIREQLNRQLHNGEFGRTILKWLNAQPETKAVMAEHFNDSLITHQNISEWRRTGYQDWLSHQERIEWLDRLTENDAQLKKREHDNDSFEALGRIFIVEIAQGLAALQQIKNPHERTERMQTLSRDFARLQNAYNWSRRVALEWDKFNGPEEIAESALTELETRNPKLDLSAIALVKAETQPGGASVLASHPQPATPNSKLETFPTAEKRQEADALQDAPRTSEALDERASVPDCGSPLPLSNPLPIKECQPIPALASTPPPAYPMNPRLIEETNQLRKTRNFPSSYRSRRFICVEG